MKMSQLRRIVFEKIDKNYIVLYFRIRKMKTFFVKQSGLTISATRNFSLGEDGNI